MKQTDSALSKHQRHPESQPVQQLKRYDIVVAGYLCVDLIPDFKTDSAFSSISELFIPGKLIEISGLSFLPGGVVANTGLALKRLGKKVFLNGLIGDDFIGKIVREWFGNYQASEGIVVTAEEGTALGIVIAPPGVDRIFLESPGCSKIFDDSFINYDAISQSRIFHFGYPPLLEQFYRNEGSQLRTLFSNIQKMGVVTSLDFSLPDQETESGKVNWPEIMKSVLSYTDIFVPSIEEALMIMLPLKYAEIQSSCESTMFIDQVPIELVRFLGKQIIDSGVKILLIKMAHRGAYLLTGDISALNEKLEVNLSANEWNHCELWCNAYQVEDLKFKNATGAGDTAVAAFLTAILDGESPEYSLKYASIAGRNNLYCHNIYLELTGWQEMTRQLISEQNEIISFEN